MREEIRGDLKGREYVSCNYNIFLQNLVCFSYYYLLTKNRIKALFID